MLQPATATFLLQRSQCPTQKKRCVGFLEKVSPIQQQQAQAQLNSDTANSKARSRQQAAGGHTIMAWWLERARSHQIKVLGHASADHRVGRKKGRRLVSFSRPMLTATLALHGDPTRADFMQALVTIDRFLELLNPHS